jgi:hypothetical protein
MPHSWIWRRSEMDSGHWGIWELLHHGIDGYKPVAAVVIVESFVVVTALDDLSPPFAYPFGHVRFLPIPSQGNESPRHE